MVENFFLRLQEFVSTIGASKRIQLLLQYVDIKPNDIILDIGGNTGKITEGYSRNCKQVVILEPKHSIVEYGKSRRPNIKFIEGGAENIPLPNEYFDKVISIFSFHHFLNQDKGLEEMKRVLRSDGTLFIIEIDPTTTKGKTLRLIETLLHTGANFYEPLELRKKVEEHGLKIISVNSTSQGYYFLTAAKSIQN
jgi:ubiquinone/menaquinone biosynthesis C-methylase UbiE